MYAREREERRKKKEERKDSKVKINKKLAKGRTKALYRHDSPILDFLR